MVYWLENGYIITSIRPCPFSQGLPAISLAGQPDIRQAGGRRVWAREYSGKEKYPLLQHSNTPINSRSYIMSAF
jgi:hypothetical protein